VTLQWRSGTGAVEACATLERGGEAVTVRYCWHDGDRWQSSRQTIALKFDVPHLGGRRTFWQCPCCGLGARKLYDIGAGDFRCRRCGRLADRSQRQKTWQRALRRAARIRGYLDSNSTPADPFPERPKRMRRAVYEGLKAEAERLEQVPPEAWLNIGGNVALRVKRGTLGAAKRRWWPGRNAASRAERRPG
jgi:hypothetical protein